MMPIHFIVYATAIIFILAVITRMIRIARMPIHLRWELYPVPHEKGRAHYGGSILEEVDWWTKPKETDKIGELAAMIPEILLLKGVWESNRNLWYGSFPLHFGLYLLIGNEALLVLFGILSLFGIQLVALYPLFALLTWVGCILGTIGAVIMFGMRTFNRGLSTYSTPSHYFNLLVLGAIYVTGIVWLLNDPMFSQNLSGFFAGLISASALPELSTAAYIHVGVTIFFTLYMPFTHMSHFFTKYFTYHSIRWEDTPNLPGFNLEEKIAKAVNQKPTWAAEHIGADGKKNWVDIVTSPVPKKDKDDK